MGPEVRSLSKEAPPVITGKVDDATVFSVFGGWSASPENQERYNPWVEVECAHRLRDDVMRRFTLRPYHLAGRPKTDRIGTAQTWLIRGLALRGWTRKMVETYMGTHLHNREWSAVADMVMTRA